jgi:hypothetical protein
MHASWVCVYSLPRTLRGGAAWSLLRSVRSCKRVLRVGARRGVWPKLADQAAEWGSVSSCSRSAALAMKTPCTHRCRSGQEKYIRQRVCAAAFGRNSCLGYHSSSSSSVCCVRLSVRALLSSDGRSAKEPTVDPSKSRWSIPARADGRSQQGSRRRRSLGKAQAVDGRGCGGEQDEGAPEEATV